MCFTGKKHLFKRLQTVVRRARWSAYCEAPWPVYRLTATLARLKVDSSWCDTATVAVTNWARRVRAPSTNCSATTSSPTPPNAWTSSRPTRRTGSRKRRVACSTDTTTSCTSTMTGTKGWQRGARAHTFGRKWNTPKVAVSSNRCSCPVGPALKTESIANALLF